MNPATAPPSTESGSRAYPLVESSDVAGPSRWRRLVAAPLKLFVGMALCQSVLGAMAVVGWTYRWMQRVVLQQWWKAGAASRNRQTFAEFAAADPRTAQHVHWPNWFLAQNFRESIRARRNSGNSGTSIVTLFKSLGESMWTNVRLGFQGIFNTWVLTLPAGVLWLFSWYDGWGNSFNKGYEQAWVGPAIGVAGIALFIASMLYVPMAQVRQGMTGNWRSFYEFRLVWTLVRRRWLANAGLAALYSLCSVPGMVLLSVIAFLPNINPGFTDLTSEQAHAFLSRYYFWAALWVFPAFVLLRLVAARSYATALLKAVQTGAVVTELLAENEWQALHRLDLLQLEPTRPRHPVIRVAAWAGTRAGRVTFGIVTGFLWFTFVAQIYIAHFFNYVGAQGWLNQPLVQLPWFHHLPVAMKNPWSDFLIAAIALFVAWRLQRLLHWLKGLRKE
ncbi:MAG: hypothetical protein L0Z50_33560 [Verrucomicrobiales bacterium]|nr:hypothetical protein [Verrucomicrobiales bacterium]